MSEHNLGQLLAEFDHLEKSLRTCPQGSIERREASMRLAEIVEEIGLRECAALGAALSATLLGASDSDPKLALMLGDRLITEMRRRGLEVIPLGDLPPV